jgi:hypothetical protein
VARFDPTRIIERADATLAEYLEGFAGKRLADPRVSQDLRRRLTEVDEELALTFEFYERMTPHWTTFVLTFACGVGGVVAIPATLGWSMLVTLGSAGLALNDTRDFVDNHEQMRRIEWRRLWIGQAIRAL